MNKSNRRIVIVGGVAGGASAATRARRLNEHAEIILIERDEHVSFANCGLPYFLGGEITDHGKLLVATPEFLSRRFRIDVRTLQRVRRLDRTAKAVEVQDLTADRIYYQPYDKLILAPGASPIVPALPGIDAKNVYVLRNVADMDRLDIAFDRATADPVIVVGAGFIGLELVEQVRQRGREVVLVELQDQVLPVLDREMAQPLAAALRAAGVKCLLGRGLSKVVCNTEGIATGVELTDGSQIAGSCIALGIGVRPNTELAAAAGLEIGAAGGILTNEFQQTSDSDIYAVGDAVEYRYGPTGGTERVPLAGPANRSGRIAGQHAATGQAHSMRPVLGTAIVRVFDQVAGLTGLSLRAARRRQLPAASVTVVAAHHAGYYPGAKPMTVKLVFDRPDGRILGAQVVGAAGVDKRIDVVATAMGMGATVWDLAHVDLAYAPPFGSAKDPVHMAAFAAGNQLDGITDFLDCDADLTGLQVLDVRTAPETERMPFPTEGPVINIPLDELRDRIGELDAARPTAVTCQSSLRAHVASCILRQRGFAEVHVVSGGTTVRHRAVTSTIDS